MLKDACCRDRYWAPHTTWSFWASSALSLHGQKLTSSTQRANVATDYAVRHAIKYRMLNGKIDESDAPRMFEMCREPKFKKLLWHVAVERLWNVCFATSKVECMQRVIFQLVLTAVGILGGQLSQISQARACAFLGSAERAKTPKTSQANRKTQPIGPWQLPLRVDFRNIWDILRFLGSNRKMERTKKPKRQSMLEYARALVWPGNANPSKRHIAYTLFCGVATLTCSILNGLKGMKQNLLLTKTNHGCDWRMWKTSAQRSEPNY